MPKLNISRRAIALALTAALSITVAKAGIVGEYGAWKAFQRVKDGGAGVLTEFNDGSRLSIAEAAGTLRLTLEEPRWSLRKDRQVDIKIEFDGRRTFSGVASAVDFKSIAIDVTNPDFIAGMAHGRTAVIRALDLSWNVDLTGVAPAFNDMLRLAVRR